MKQTTLDFQILNQVTNDIRPTIPLKCPLKLKKIIIDQWSATPEFRLPASKLVQKISKILEVFSILQIS